jgi:hypothetical protein
MLDWILVTCLTLPLSASAGFVDKLLQSKSIKYFLFIRNILRISKRC